MSAARARLHWSAPFVGLPWADRGRDASGVDCWGLLRLVFASRAILLPSYAEAYQSAAEARETAILLARDSAAHPWREVEADDEREWDVALFRRAGLPAHVGIVIRPGDMLHIDRDATSAIAGYRSGAWAPRLIGFYRHAELA